MPTFLKELVISMFVGLITKQLGCTSAQCSSHVTRITESIFNQDWPELRKVFEEMLTGVA